MQLCDTDHLSPTGWQDGRGPRQGRTARACGRAPGKAAEGEPSLEVLSLFLCEKFLVFSLLEGGIESRFRKIIFPCPVNWHPCINVYGVSSTVVVKTNLGAGGMGLSG